MSKACSQKSATLWIVFAVFFAVLPWPSGSRAKSVFGETLIKANFKKDLAGFESVGGSWKTEAGKLVQSETKGTALLLAGKPDWNNYSATARIRLRERAVEAEAGLVLQFRNPNSYLVFSVKEKKGGPYAVLRIVSEQPGLSIVADQLPLKDSLQNWHDLRADVHGVDVLCYVNGKPAASFSFEGTPPAYNSHGKTWSPDPDKGRVGLISGDAASYCSAFEVRRLKDFSHIVVPQRGSNKGGKLLPRQSYSETMTRLTDWLNECDRVVYNDKAPASLRSLPPYLLSNFVNSADEIYAAGGEYAFNHALLIDGAIQYFVYSGNPKYLEMARKTADWHIQNRTPANWALPYLPPSVVNFKPDGSWEGQDWGLEPDKSAYMASSFLRLFAVMGDKKYLNAALDTSQTLRKLQGPDGNWPFRVNAKTGETKVGYTCSQLWYVKLFEQLAHITGDKRYLENRDKAFHWLVENPVRDNKWLGLYGDIVSGAESYDQWVALETAMYLIDHRMENPTYVNMAKGILDWLNGILVVDYGLLPNVPGALEQTQYKVVLTHHTLRLAEMYGKLYEATGDSKYKQLAIDIGNSVTWCLMSDGKMRQGFFYHASGIPLNLCFNDQFARLMSCVPETAPQDENHLLQSTSFVGQIRYGAKEIEYRTAGNSYDVLKVVSRPRMVESGGQVLPIRQDPRSNMDGWSFDEGTGLLKIMHQTPDVSLTLR